MRLNGDCLVLLYSPSQKCFHWESYRQMQERNMTVFLNDLPVDYVTMGFFETLELLRRHIKGLEALKD